MEGKKTKKSRGHEDTAGNGRDSGMVTPEGILSNVGYADESRSKGLKKRKRSKEVEVDRDSDQEIIASKKKDSNLRDREVEDDGPCGHAAEDQVLFRSKVGTSELESTPAKKRKAKKSRMERETENGGHAHNGDLEVETVRDQEVVHDQFHNSGREEFHIRKKKGKKSRRDGEVEVPGDRIALNFDGVSVQYGVGGSGMESIPAKKRKGKESHGNREAEVGFPGNQSDSYGDGVRGEAVVQRGVDDYDEQSLPTKKEGKKCRRKKEVAGQGSRDNSDLEEGRARDQGVGKEEVEKFDLQLLPTKAKKGKKNLRDKEVEAEGHRSSIGSDGHRVTDQAPVLCGSNEDRLEVSPVRKNRGKKNRRDKEVEAEGQRSSISSDGDRVTNQTLVLCGSKEDGLGVSPVRKNRGKKNRGDKEVEAEGHRSSIGSGGDRVTDQAPVLCGSNEDRLEVSPVRNNRRKKNRRDKEVEAEGQRSSISSDGDRVTNQTLVLCGSKEDGLGVSPVRKNRGKKNRGDKEVEAEGHRSSIGSDGDRVTNQTVVLSGSEGDGLGVLPVRKNRGKKNRGDKEVEAEGHRSSIGSEGDRVTNQTVVLCGSKEDGLGVSPVRKKKGKKSHRYKEIDGDGQLFSDSDIAKVQNEIISRSGVVESDGRLSAIKKVKKRVRFQEPEIHWREQADGEEHQEEDEEDVRSEDPELGDEENSSMVREVLSGALHEGRGWGADLHRMDLKYGYFTKEEDEKLKTAVYDFIKAKNWDESEGLNMLLHSRSHREARGAWLEIAKCLPHRPVKFINSRAQRLLSNLKRGTWSQEDLEKLRELQERHGRDWVAIEREMGRPAQLCKDKWRVLRLAPVLRKGKWNEEEFDRLSMYVRWSLKLKEQFKSKEVDHRMLRDDINWEAIAEKMGRRSAACSVVWYQRLASSLIAEGNWANGDDRRLLRSLLESGASSEEAVEWDELLDDRDGLTCERRWYQMIRLVPERGKPFEDKLEQLVRRYAPDLIGVEEDFNTGTVVDQ